jgi:hypothetical protein
MNESVNQGAGPEKDDLSEKIFNHLPALFDGHGCWKIIQSDTPILKQATPTDTKAMKRYCEKEIMKVCFAPYLFVY